MAAPRLRAPDDWLERDLFTLDLASDHFAPLIWRDALGLAAGAYLNPELAEQQLRRVRLASVRHAEPNARAKGPKPRLQTLRAGDLRARQEWLEAVLQAGAARVLFDLNSDGQHRGTALSAALLAEVLSYKRGLACL
jgi:hypothetical protein